MIKSCGTEFMKRLILRLYPFLIACYPIFALRNYNILYVDLASILRTLLIVILITAWLWIFAKVLIFHNWDQAGVATSLAMILLLSYGHIHIQSEKIFGEQVRHSVLTIVLGSIFSLGVWLAVRRQSTLEIVRNFLATVGVILILMTTVQSLYYEFGAYRLAKTLSSQESQSISEPSASSKPDIYLIILDAHGRADVLKKKYGYDNSSFLEKLQDMGFYVAKCSQSNYAS